MKKILSQFKSCWIYMLIIGIIYYLPQTIISLFHLDFGLFLFILLIVTPLTCIISSFVCGYKHGFNLVLILLATLLFIPSVFIFQNSSALPYCLLFGGFSLLGNIVGMLFQGFKFKR